MEVLAFIGVLAIAVFLSWVSDGRLLVACTVAGGMFVMPWFAGEIAPEGEELEYYAIFLWGWLLGFPLFCCLLGALKIINTDKWEV